MLLLPNVKQYILSVIRLSQLYSSYRVIAFHSACVFKLEQEDSISSS